MPWKLLFPLVLILTVGCSQGPTNPQPVVRADGAHVYEWKGVEFPFPAILTFDGAAWTRLEPIWNDGILLGYEYAHDQRPRKLLYNVQHGEGGFTVSMREGQMGESDWIPDGPYRFELPDGTTQEGEMIAGKLNGTLRTYYRNGSLKSEFTMRDDKRDGAFVTYTTSGIKETSGVMADDEVSILTLYDGDGLPMSTKDVKTGETITRF